MTIEEIINTIYPLPQASMDSLLPHISTVSYPKGYLLLRANTIEPNVYFIRKGIVRAFAHTNDCEINFWFGKEGDPMISMKSYVQNKQGYEDIELLEDCDLYELKNNALQKLFTYDIHMANWGRKFAELELVKTEERLISHQFRTATERYKDLLTNSPELLQRVSLGHIASYLGITQVSLSRIRAEIK